jgi:heme a synthase
MSTLTVPGPTPPAAVSAGATTGFGAHTPWRTSVIEDMDPTYIDSAANVRAVRRWMYATMLAVIIALVVGGITRLTESGLSITEWKPVSGVLPPLSDADWQEAFRQFQQIPQAQTVHAGITLERFKVIFFWEWIHRVLARLVGLVIALPFFYLLLTKRLRPSLRLRLANLPLLVGLQGAMGWYMVQSGLTERTSVSQYRLTAHLALALVIYVIAAWTAFRLRAPDEASQRGVGTDRVVAHRGGVDGGALALAVLVFAVILTGGFVAGLDAGLVYNTWPLMGGQFVPPTYGDLSPAWLNSFENRAAVQFNHRLLAYLTLAGALWLAWRRRAAVAPAHPASRAWLWVPLAALLQVALGVATVLLHVPIAIAALHQLGAVALLTAALYAAALPGRAG